MTMGDMESDSDRLNLGGDWNVFTPLCSVTFDIAFIRLTQVSVCCAPRRGLIPLEIATVLRLNEGFDCFGPSICCYREGQKVQGDFL